MRRNIVLAGTVLIITSGCDLASRVSVLETQVSGLRAIAQTTESDAMNRRIAALENAAGRYSSASFKPGEDSLYQRVDTVLGPLLLILDDIQPLADGSRIKIRIGNLSAAYMVNPKMQVKWHEKRPDLAPGATGDELTKHAEAINAWISGERTKEIEAMKDLPAGTWTVVTVNLPGVPPDRLAYVDLKVTTDQVKLTMNQ